MNFRDAVVEVSENAKHNLPESTERINKAIALVLHGHVELQSDGTARVASQTDGKTVYTVNGSCQCRDYENAPRHFCKHKLSVAIYKRALPLTTEPPQTHSEAPASINFRVLVSGRECQITLRDSDEQRLLQRLEVVLQRFPVEQAKEEEKPKGWCSIHNVSMRLNKGKNGRKDWYSHKTENGWCNAK